MPQAIPLALGSLLFSLGAPLAVVNAVAIGGIGTIIGFGATVGLSIGASYAANAIMGNQQQAGGATNSPDIRASIRQAIPAQRVIYGTTRVGGAVFFLEVKPPFLYLGLLIAARPITSIDGTTVGEQAVSFDAQGDASTTPFNNGSTIFLKRSVRLGSSSQTIDPLIQADFPDVPSSFRQRGISTVVYRFRYGADFDEYQALWGNVQIPNMLMEVKGSPVYDPRDPTQIMFSDPQDRAEVEAAMATWKWSNTAALIQADYLIQPYGARILPSRIRWDKIAEAASYDEQPIGLKGGGVQKRYTIDGMIQKNQSRLAVMQSMLSANRGFVAQSEGRVWITSAKAADPVLTITDGMLVGGFQYRDAQPKKDLVNRVRVRFVAPDREFQTVDGPLRNDTASQAADGEDLEQTIELPFTSDHRRAQRISKAFMDQSRHGKTLAVALTPEHLAKAGGEGVDAGAVVRVWSELFPQINGLYQVGQGGWSEDFATFQLGLTEYAPEVENGWDAAADEQDFVIIDVDDFT